MQVLVELATGSCSTMHEFHFFHFCFKMLPTSIQASCLFGWLSCHLFSLRTSSRPSPSTVPLTCARDLISEVLQNQWPSPATLTLPLSLDVALMWALNPNSFRDRTRCTITCLHCTDKPKTGRILVKKVKKHPRREHWHLFYCFS